MHLIRIHPSMHANRIRSWLGTTSRIPATDIGSSVIPVSQNTIRFKRKQVITKIHSTTEIREKLLTVSILHAHSIKFASTQNVHLHSKFAVYDSHPG